MRRERKELFKKLDRLYGEYAWEQAMGRDLFSEEAANSFRDRAEEIETAIAQSYGQPDFYTMQVAHCAKVLDERCIPW
jgi:hypothetical protein